MNIFLKFSGILIIVFSISTANAQSLISNPNIISSTTSKDSQIFNFILGQWKLIGGNCVSGSQVNWGGGDFKDYQILFTIKNDLTFKWELSHLGKLTTDSTGRFAILNAILILNSEEYCQYTSNSISCSGENTTTSTLISIQNDQLWLLSNQGSNGGSCPPQDIFIMKFGKN